MDSSEFLNTVRTKIKTFDNDAEVILFGSRARGDFKNDSDWDLLILLNIIVNEKLKEEIRDVLFELELESEEVISSIIQSKKRWDELKITPLYKNVAREGIKV